MSIINISKKDITNKGIITIKKSDITVDTTPISAWETDNRKASDDLNRYNKKISSGEYMSDEDRAAYKSAMELYISTSNNLRRLNSNYSDDDNKAWEKSVADMKQNYEAMSGYYSQFKDADEYTEYTRFQKYAGQSFDDLMSNFGEAKEFYKESLTEKIKSFLIIKDDPELVWLYNNLYNLYPYTSDFEENSKYVSTQYAEPEYNAWTNTYSKPFGDFDYDYINRNPRAIGVATANNVSSGASFAGVDKAELEQMTDREIAIFNYIYKTQSPTMAYGYIRSITSDLNERERAKATEMWAKEAEENPFMMSAFSVLTSPLKAASFVGQVGDYIDDGKIDENEAYNKYSYINSTIRNEVSQNVEEKWGGVGSFGYNVGMSMADFLFTTAITGGNSMLASTIMGTSAAADTVIMGKNRGLSDDQAFLLGTIAGVTEIATEKLSIDTLLDSTGLGKNALTYILKNALAEGGEEAASNIVNTVADVLISKDKSEWQTAINEYRSKDMSPEKAFWRAVGDQAISLGLDFLGGAISGGVMGGGGAAINYVGNAIGDISRGHSYKGVESDLVNESLEIDPNNSYAQRMQGRLDSGKTLSSYQLGKLVRQNESNLIVQDKSKIKSAAEARLKELGETGDIGKISDVIVKARMGEDLTRSEQSILVNSKYGRRVSTEMNPDIIESGGYTSEWAENIGTERINSEAYNRGIAVASEVSASKEKTASVTENATAKEIPSEGKISTSESKANQPVAKATMTDNEGNKIEAKVAKIAEVENGEASLELEGGQTVKASDVDFENSGIGFVYNAATEMVSGVGGFNVDAANVMVRGFGSNGSLRAAGLYVSGFNEAYRYGAMGYPVSALATGKVTSKLSAAQREAAYNLGKAYGEGKVSEKQAKIDSTVSKKDGKDSGKVAKKGKVYFDSSTVGKNLTEMQRASLKGLRVVAEAMGVDIRIFESEMVDGKRQGANGWYDPSNHSVYIDLYAGSDGNGVMLFTAAHELTHHIREMSPAKFKVFADALLEEYTKNGVSIDELISRKLETLEANKRLEGMTEEKAYDLAYEEVVADACESMLVDSNAIEALSKKIQAKDKGLWKTIKDFITELVNKIRAAYEGVDPDSHEGNLVREMKDSAERLQKLWVDALLEASEYNSGHSDLKSTNNKGVIKSSPETSTSSKPMNVKNTKVNENQMLAEAKAEANIAKAKPAEIKKQSSSAFNTAEFNDINIRHTLNDIGINMHVTDALSPMIKKYVAGEIASKAALVDAIRSEFGAKIGAYALTEENLFRLVDIIDYEANKVWEAWEKKKKKQGAAVNSVTTDNVLSDSVRTEINANTESVSPKFSERTWTESEYVTHRDEMAEKIAKALDVSVQKAKSYIDDINSIAKIIADDRTRLDYEASSFGSAFVSNVEYGGSFDYTTLCKKRRIYTGTFTEIQKRLKDVALSPDDILKIRNMLIEEGIEATCGLCYVEGSRANMGKFAKEFIRLYKRDNPDAWIPNMADVNTPDGVEQMRIGHPEAYDQYVYFWNHYGKLKDSDPALFASQQKPKLYEARKEYKGEILEHFEDTSTVEKKNRNGGIRMQSFSDFEIVHLIDTMQVIMDMSTVGLAGQAYTKVPEFAKAFGNTGLKINLSLIAKGVDADGNLIFDDREGMPHKTAFDLRDKYSKNVGTIIVTFTDEQLLAAMADPRIDFIIPFHRSQWKKGQYGAMGLPKGTKDYTYMQNEKLIKKTYHEYRGKLVPDKASNYMPNEYWDFSKSGKENAEAYLEMCAENNKRPKFYKLLNYDGNGRYSLKEDGSTDGYWKLLIDFKMYDNNGIGSPQTAVTPTFNMDEARTMLNEYQGGHSKYPVASSVVDKFVEGYNREVVKSDGVKYSDRDYSYESLVSKPDMKITTIDSNVPRNRADVVAQAKRNAAKIGKLNPKDGSVSVHIDDTGENIVLSTGGLRHGLDRRFDVNAPVTVKAGEILQNSIRINEMIPSNDNAESSYALIGVAKNKKGELYIVRSVVNRFKSELVSMDTLYAINAKTEPNLGTKKGNQSGAYPQGTLSYDSFLTDSTISIAQLLEFVNRYFPDILPESVLRHFGYDARPDGELGENALYSDRSPDSYSNRSLLTNALETAAQNDIEREKLTQYKQKIELINAEEQKLHDLRKQIKELSFAKGPRDTKAIKSLQFEANQAANRINTYDRQLLNLESTKALKGVLEREKAQARKRAEKQGKEALERYREKVAKTQRELMTRYQESRKKGVEGRKKTEMRHKIKDVVNELNQYLLKGTKDKHVPIELQKAVAEALDAVNMDTVGAEERIAKKRAEMMSAKSPEVVERLAKEIEHIGEMGGNMEAKLSRLKTAYDSIINSDDPLVANSHDEVISNTIERVMEIVGNTPLRDMSLYQLESVYDMYKMVLHSVRTANKAFKAKKSEEISVIANRVMEEVDKLGKKKALQTKTGEAVSTFDWNNQKPIYAFERIGSGTFTEVFNNVRAGEDVWAVDMTEAKDFLDNQKQKHKYNSWDFRKRYAFTSSTGRQFELTLDQIMSLYAYSKRGTQAKDHLKYGGFVFDGLTEVNEKTKLGITKTYQLKDATAYNLSDETLAEIISKLTPEQKAYADAMQDYLSTVMGEKGNEVSLELYGVKLFKEKNYFPLKSAPQYLERAREQAQGDTKIKNKGFTKETVPKAKNPIVLTSFMDVWSGHVNEMSMYHAFTLALEDFYRVFNYKTPASETMDSEGVIPFIENARGSAAIGYIDQLLKDLNGGARSDPRETATKALMSNFKKASVMASLSVVIQQPSAIVRAEALIDAKYFIGKKMSKGKHKETWAEVKKYAPVAIIKEMGYFDTGMGQSSTEWLKGDKTWKDKMDDVISKAPALADEVTWCAMWNAVKRETAGKNPTLKTNSEEFLRLVGERFTEVVTKTQVYDSTLARSANMRSKSVFMSMLTAFMAEPTTSINMLQDAFIKGNKKNIARTLGAVYGSVLLNSALVSLIYAMRDDDEDETFLEKYLSRFVTEAVDGINPLTNIPFVKDIWSLLQGYDIERMDMSLISDLTGSLQQLVKVVSKDTSDMSDEELDEHHKAINEKILGVMDSLVSLTGIPLKNIRRDFNGIVNGVKTIIEDSKGRKTTAGSLEDNILEDVKDSVPVWGWLPDESKGDKLYDAIIKGDTAYVDRMKSGYKSEAAINSAIRKALRENDPRIKEAAEALNRSDYREYDRIRLEIIGEGHFEEKDVNAAIAQEYEKMQPDKPAESKEEKVESDYKVDWVYDAIISGDKDMASVMKEDIINTYIANGKTQKEAESSYNSALRKVLREKEPRIRSAAEAMASGNGKEFSRILNEIADEGNFSRNIISGAIAAEAEKIKDAKK